MVHTSISIVYITAYFKDFLEPPIFAKPRTKKKGPQPNKIEKGFWAPSISKVRTKKKVHSSPAIA